MTTKPTQTDLLQELVYARGPCGQEDEVRVICERELNRHCDKVWVDTAGNVVGLVRGAPAGKGSGGQSSAIRVMAHMDELGMIVKRVDATGAIRVANICAVGGMRPGCFGQGPVDILADTGIVPGVLSLGPQHSTAETANVEEAKTKALDWSHLHVFTHKTAEELAKLGVHAGTRVAIARERRKLWETGDCVGGYFMDDRAAIVIALAAAAQLKAAKKRSPQDVYFVMTTEEECGGVGAAYASRTLPGDTTLALDVGPVCAEYGTEFRRDPIIAYGDARGLYCRALADALLGHARRLGQNAQCAVWECYGSDASIAKSFGQVARAGLLCIPTQNTHGYEIILRESLQTCADLLAAFLESGDGSTASYRNSRTR